MSYSDHRHSGENGQSRLQSDSPPYLLLKLRERGHFKSAAFTEAVEDEEKEGGMEKEFNRSNYVFK